MKRSQTLLGLAALLAITAGILTATQPTVKGPNSIRSYVKKGDPRGPGLHRGEIPPGYENIVLTLNNQTDKDLTIAARYKINPSKFQTLQYKRSIPDTPMVGMPNPFIYKKAPANQTTVINIRRIGGGRLDLLKEININSPSGTVIKTIYRPGWAPGLRLNETIDQNMLS